MSAKLRTVFACQNCGYHSPRWLGRCPDCNEWNTFSEERVESEKKSAGGRAQQTRSAPQPISEIEGAEEPRYISGIGELDRVLGGGVVPGSVTLIGGDPGIGKSTLVLQALAALARTGVNLYVSGEESAQQIKMRADRLKVPEHLDTAAANDRLLFVAETAVEHIIDHARTVSPCVIAIDSIQTMFTEQMTSAPGSIGQVRECAAQLVALSKQSNLATFLIGHVTKEGAFAGPRVLEHMVDTVLYFEGDRGHPFRILRAVKNRFGSTNEIGVFEMKEEGLQPVQNPSALFLAERPVEAPGSVVVANVEGTRPILVEIQALVSPSSFGTPRRTTLGIDGNRVALLIAILEKKMGLHLIGQDVFVNVAGGVRIDEPAAGLGVMISIASSFLDKPIDPQTVIIGEVGLAGEIRAVGQVEIRVREAVKLGFTRAIVPESTRKYLPKIDGIEVCGVGTLSEVWAVMFP